MRRRPRALTFAAAALLLAAVAPATAQQAAPPAAPPTMPDAAQLRFGAERFQLPNGLEVVVLPSHRAPVVTQMVWYRVGAADEPRGKSGIAHFLEHLMFKGTKTVPAGEFQRLVAENGGRDNAFTTDDYTAYHETVAKDRLELVMRLEADRMTGLVLDDSVVLPERDVILEERRTRIDNNPSSLLGEQVEASLWLHHPYRIPTIGWESEMHGLTTADALDFYRRWYHPNNAILVVSGDVETAEVRRLAEKYFGPIPAGEVPARTRVEEPPRVAATRLQMTSPQVAQAQWSRTYLAPSYTGGETQHAYPLQVLGELLGGGATSILYKELVVEQKLALAAGAWYGGGRRDFGTFGVYATPRAGVELPAVEAAIEVVLAKVLKDGIPGPEVERAKARMVASEVYARDGVFGPARMFGAALALGRSVEDVEAWPARLSRVTAEEVAAAARAVLKPENAVTAALLPQPGAVARPAVPPGATQPPIGGGTVQ